VFDFDTTMLKQIKFSPII